MAVPCPKQCQVVWDDAYGDVPPVRCGSGEVELFRSDLDSPPDGTFFVNFTSNDCTVTFTFYQHCGRSITKSFAPAGAELGVALTVADVDRITVTCSGGTTESTCQIPRWYFGYHHCRCCG